MEANPRGGRPPWAAAVPRPPRGRQTTPVGDRLASFVFRYKQVLEFATLRAGQNLIGRRGRTRQDPGGGQGAMYGAGIDCVEFQACSAPTLMMGGRTLCPRIAVPQIVCARG